MSNTFTFLELLENPKFYNDAFDVLLKKMSKLSGDSPSKSSVVSIFSNVISEILSAPENSKDSSFQLKFSTVPADEFNEEAYIDICLWSPEESKCYSTCFHDWGALREMHILPGDSGLDKAELLAELLWDCTFWGFSAADVVVERDKLVALKDEDISNCVSFDSVKELYDSLKELE
jgi:hypothetical protein